MFLGIDPWIRKLWYALIEPDLSIVDAGILLQDQKKPTRDDQFARMHDIFAFFEKMIKMYPVKHIGIEKLYFTQKNKNNAEFVYGIRWALMMLFRTYTLPVEEYTPNQIKRFITWNGNASKEAMQSMVQKLFSLDEMPKYHDTADALGIAFMVKRLYAWKK